MKNRCELLARAASPGLLVLLSYLAWTAAVWPKARLEEQVQFEQPDGTRIELRGHGSEFHAIYETLDGYTVIFVPESRAYFYARVSENGEELVSSGLQVGQGNPETMGLPQHVRIRAEAAAETARANRERWESAMRIRERWESLKAARSDPRRLKAQSASPVMGQKLGLTLLIDFEDQPGTVPRSNIEPLLNGDNYRVNGNRGSVKEYFAEVSGGRLTYSNLVFGYIRIPNSVHPRSYYNDVNRITFDTVNELIRDAIRIWTNQPNFMTEIVPQLERLTLDESGMVRALNVFIAGSNSAVWAKGLWYHQANLSYVGPQELWPGGLKVNRYQMSPIPAGTALTIGAFCHESAHLICDFPDLYDYDERSQGAGNFCLMSANFYDGNPPHFCAYLKLMAGWATVTDIIPGPAATHSLKAAGTNDNYFLRYQPFLGSKEYFLIENRQRAGRDLGIPGSGILVWHIDELGNHNNENLLPNSVHANYEVTLVQADGRWDLQRDRNLGDLTDFYFSGNSSPGYSNRFADDTTPSAAWWNGYRSGLELRDFSIRSNQMTLVAEVKPQSILRDPLSQAVTLGEDLFLSVQTTSNEAYSYQWFKDGSPVSSADGVAGVNGPVLAISNIEQGDAGEYSVIITDRNGQSQTSQVAEVTLANLRPLAASDLGDASLMPGAKAILNNTYQISAGGSGFLGVADGFYFLSEKIRGDFDARLRVVEMNPDGVTVDAGSDGLVHTGGVGLMVRGHLEPGSWQAAALIRPGFLDSGEFQAVVRTGELATASVVARSRAIPQLDNWVRLKREGSLVSMYYSTNGTRWDWAETVTLPLEEEALLGIAASSYNPIKRVVAGVGSYIVQTNRPPTFAISTWKSSAVEGTGEAAVIQVVSSRAGPLEIPYTVSGDGNGTLYESLSGVLSLPFGTNVAHLRVAPIDNAAASSPQMVTVNISGGGNDVTQNSARAIIFDDEEQGRGLLREIYTDIGGTQVSDLTGHFRYPGSALLGTAPLFEAAIGERSGQVLSGFITPPESGAYIFYLASAHGSELWLSPNSLPENAVKIAEEHGTNTRRNWAGYGGQSHISAPILLTKGRWYFVKAIHKTGLGERYFGVAWQRPGEAPPAAGSAPISGDYLAWALPRSANGSVGSFQMLRAPGTGRPMLQMNKTVTAPFTIEASSDLVRWQPILIDSSAREVDVWSLDPIEGSQPWRYYRLLGQP